jgi:hypothetical protein
VSADTAPSSRRATLVRGLAGVAVIAGTLIAAAGALQPWPPAPADYGRDAVTVLAISGLLFLVGLAMLVRPSSRGLAVVAVVLATVVVVLAVRDRLDALDRFGGVLGGLDAVLLGGGLSAVAAVARIATRIR